MLELILIMAIVYYVARRGAAGRKRKFRVLRSEVPVWEGKNIISSVQGDAILGLYKLTRAGPKRKMDMVKVFTLIGAIFVGIGVIFFVASNWQRIPAHLRTFVLLSITVATLYLGYYVRYEKKIENLGKSLLLLASLFWGGAVALIAQIYQIPVSENWLIMLIWAFPIVPIAVFLDNEYVHILASGLFLIWNFLYTANSHVPNYYYPLIAFVIMLPTARSLIISRRINVAGLLIASVYCCFYKYEWLALIISAGLLVWYLLQREEFVYLCAASLSFLFWMITFFTVREFYPNVYFLIPVQMLLYLSYKDRVRENLVIVFAGLLVWLNLTVHSISLVFGIQEWWGLGSIVLTSTAGILMYVAGIAAANRRRVFPQMHKVCGYAVVFVCTYLLSFRSLLDIDSTYSFSAAYIYVCTVLIILGAVLLMPAARRNYFKTRIGMLELIGWCAALAGNLIIFSTLPLFAKVLAANTVLVIFAIITVFAGVELKMPSVFTSGILMFALFIITRYVDVGWRLREKSLFFIVGGLFILSLGTFLEKQRKKVLERMK